MGDLRANGGYARAAKLTKEERSSIATIAAKKRWSEPRDNKPKKTKAHSRLKKIEDNQRIIWQHMLELMRTKLRCYDSIAELEQRIAELEGKK